MVHFVYLRLTGHTEKANMFICVFGVWLSLARAPALGAGGRRFESCHPDVFFDPGNPLPERLPGFYVV